MSIDNLCKKVLSLNIQSPYKNEVRCRYIIESLTGHKFPSSRPEWLINPNTNRRLELDCFCPSLRIALEYNGKQHYVKVNRFQRTKKDFQNQIYRDKVKYLMCKIHNIDLIIVPHTIDKENLVRYILGKLILIERKRNIKILK